MWKTLLTIVKQLFAVTKETQQNKADINALRERLKSKEEEDKELRQEFRRMTEIMQRVLFEMERDRELSERDRENLRLQLENMLLRSGRYLPPAQPDDELKKDEPKVLSSEIQKPDETQNKGRE
jgi:hypothetical protein